MSVSNIVLAAAMAVAGCSVASAMSSKPTSGAVTADSSSLGEARSTEIELRFDERVEYRDLEFHWLELQDSRCPIGVTCVWAGEIIATVEVTRGEEGPVEIELLLQIGREPKTARAFGYELRLQGVDPHPKEGVTPERGDYVAQIELVEG